MVDRSVATWLYRCQMAGPSTTAWRTRSAGAVLHLRWLTDNARAVGGCQSVTARGAIPPDLAGWLEQAIEPKRQPGRLDRFCPSRNTTPTPTPTWTPTTPTIHSRRSGETLAQREGPNAPSRDRDGGGG